MTKAETSAVAGGDSPPIPGMLDLDSNSWRYGFSNQPQRRHMCNLLRPYASIQNPPSRIAISDHQTISGGDFYTLSQTLVVGTILNDVASGPSQQTLPTNTDFPFISIPLVFRSINIARYDLPDFSAVVALSDVTLNLMLMIDKDGEPRIFVEGNFDNPNFATEVYNSGIRRFMSLPPILVNGYGFADREVPSAYATTNVGEPTIEFAGDYLSGITVGIVIPAQSATSVVTDSESPLDGVFIRVDASSEYEFKINSDMFARNSYYRAPDSPTSASFRNGVPFGMTPESHFGGGCCD